MKQVKKKKTMMTKKKRGENDVGWENGNRKKRETETETGGKSKGKANPETNKRDNKRARGYIEERDKRGTRDKREMIGEREPRKRSDTKVHEHFRTTCDELQRRRRALYLLELDFRCKIMYRNKLKLNILLHGIAFF